MRTIPTTSDFVYYPESCQLPLRRRVAWGAAVVERLLRLYSPYARRMYRQDEALAFAWDFALGGPHEPADAACLVEQIGDLDGEAETEHYGAGFLMMGLGLVWEVAHDDGKGCITAIGEGGVCFSHLQIWRQGADIGGTNLSREDGERMNDYTSRQQHQLLRCARECFDLALANRAGPIRRDMFAHVPLDLSAEPAPRDLIARLPRRPPPHEEDYLRAAGLWLGP